MSKGRASSRRRRDERYYRAIRRQVAFIERHQANKFAAYLPAPVDEFLRPGDRIESFLDEPPEVQR